MKTILLFLLISSFVSYTMNELISIVDNTQQEGELEHVSAIPSGTFTFKETYEVFWAITGQRKLKSPIPILEELLLNKGENRINFVNITGYTPLHYACIFNAHEVVAWLLLLNDASLYIQNKDGKYPIHYVKDSEILKLFLLHNDEVINLKTSKSKTLLDLTEQLIRDLIIKLCGKSDTPRLSQEIIEYTVFKKYLIENGAKRGSELE